MLLKFNINFLTRLDIENGKRSPATFDLTEDGSILRIVKAVEWSIVYGEPVGPEVKDTLNWLRSLWMSGTWVFYDFARRVITTEGAGCAFEVGRGCARIITAGTCNVSVIYGYSSQN